MDINGKDHWKTMPASKELLRKSTVLKIIKVGIIMLWSVAVSGLLCGCIRGWTEHVREYFWYILACVFLTGD